MKDDPKTKARLRDDEKAYVARIHTTITHSPRMAVLMRRYWRFTRRLRSPKDIDIWTALARCVDLDVDADARKLPRDPVRKGLPLADTVPRKIAVSELKQAFRQFIANRHGGRCCYCRRALPGVAHARPIDHVLPKATYRHFAVDFWNLAVACFDCNQYKSDKDWSKGAFATRKYSYPGPAWFSDMYHPRYHRFDEHVRYVRVETNELWVTFFVGTSGQGRQLCRDHLAEMARREMTVENNPAVATAMRSISAYGERLEAEAAPRFQAFYDALNASMSRFGQ